MFQNRKSGHDIPAIRVPTPFYSTPETQLLEKSPKRMLSPLTVYTEASKLTFDQKNDDFEEFLNEVPKKKTIFMKVNRNSKIEFGLLSDHLSDISALEPFSMTKQHKSNRSDFTVISPKQALLYNECGIDILTSKVNKPLSDQNHHSFEVVRSDFYEIFNETPRKVKKPGVRTLYRRKSCLCTWCGGASALEKAIQNSPGISDTIYQIKNEDKKSSVEQAKAPSGSRLDFWRSKLNAAKKLPKRSIKNQPSLVLEDSPELGRKVMQRTSTVFVNVKRSTLRIRTSQDISNKQQSSQVNAKVPVKTLEKEGDSPVSDRSINLEQSPTASSKANRRAAKTMGLVDRKNTVTFATPTNSPTKIKPGDSLKYIYNFETSPKEIERPVRENKTVEHGISRIAINNANKMSPTPEKGERNIFKMKKVKRKHKKSPQKSFVCSAQQIKDIYNSVISFKNQKNPHRPQTATKQLGEIERKRFNLSENWGFDISKASGSLVERPLQTEYLQKHESTNAAGVKTLKQKLSFLKTGQTTKKQYYETASSFRVKSVETFENSHRSLKLKSIESSQRGVKLMRE